MINPALAIRWMGDLARATVLVLVVAGSTTCTTAVCSTSDHASAQCRVIVEHQLAGVRTAAGTRIDFVDPEHRVGSGPEAGTASWIQPGPALRRVDGRIRATSTGRVDIRVAGFGGFALRIDHAAQAPVELELRLENIAADTRLTLVDVLGGQVAIEPDDPTAEGLERIIHVDVGPGRRLLLLGERDCPAQYSILALGDIQTNPLHFSSIVDQLHDARIDAENRGRPILGMVILGDLAERSSEAELRGIAATLSRSPVPAAVIPGNHDVFSPLAPHYNSEFGPGNYRFSICGTGMAMFDTGSGGLADSIEASLASRLSAREGELRVLAHMHHPPSPGVTGSGWSRDDQADALLVEAAIAGVDMILAGHVHSILDFPDVPVADHRLRQIVVGTGGASQVGPVPTYGYLRLDFDEGQSRPRACFVEVPPAGTPKGLARIPAALDCDSGI